MSRAKGALATLAATSDKVRGVTVYTELLGTDGRGQLRIALPDGSELLVPSTIFDVVSHATSTANYNLRRMADTAQRAAHYPLDRHPHLVEARDGFGNHTLAAPDAQGHIEGTPYLAWTKSSGVNGWSLQVSGISGGGLGFAPWNDPAGVDGLIPLLTDQDALLAWVGVMRPEEAAKLSARQTALTLSKKRGALPVLSLGEVRAALMNARVTDGWRKNLVRNLPVTVGGKRLMLAAAVSPGSFDEGRLPRPDFALPRHQRYLAREQAEREALERWYREAHDAFAAAGLREVSLPQPNYNRGNHILWLTKLSDEAWASVQAAAAEAVQNFRMHHGAKVF